MNAVDFLYDGIYLSDFGYIICSFDSSNSPETISMGSEITFTQTPVSNGKYYMTTSARYENCIETEFCICKDPDKAVVYDDYFITDDEQNYLMRWLNRRNMCNFSLVENGKIDIVYEGSFNLSKVELNGKVIGMSLHFLSNRPFGIAGEITHEFTIDSNNSSYQIKDTSDEIGYGYPKLVITLAESGDLTITNSFDNRTTTINNCVSGEIITIENMIISSSNSSHQTTIMDDFNFVFPKLWNSFTNRVNTYTFNLACQVELSYKPIRKVGL